MLDQNLLKTNLAELKKAFKHRGFKIDLDMIVKLDQQLKEAQQVLEKLRNTQNQSADQIKKTQGKSEKARLIDQSKEIKQQVKQAEEIWKLKKQEFNELFSELPNLPQPEVIVGKADSENRVVKEVGQPTNFSFKPKDYLELAKIHDLIDLERAGKTSGSRFGFIKNQLVDLQFALVAYALAVLRQAGFNLFTIPVLLKKEMMEKTGYDTYTKGQDAFYIEKDDLYLIGTGEHALICYRADEILDNQKLPLRYTTYSSCFRREAGSYGKDTKGIIRVHQFEKLEMVSFCSADQSTKEFNQFLEIQEQLVSGLKLPYHLLEVCTGDLPKPSSKVIDLECWIPSENKYRETHSVSNCTDYQARNLNIRYQLAKGKNEYVHIVNGTAFAIPRILVAIMENYQQADGSIVIPEALRKYTPWLGGKIG